MLDFLKTRLAPPPLKSYRIMFLVIFFCMFWGLKTRYSLLEDASRPPQFLHKGSRKYVRGVQFLLDAAGIGLLVKPLTAWTGLRLLGREDEHKT